MSVCLYTHVHISALSKEKLIEESKCWLEAEIWIHARWTQTSAGEYVMWFMEPRVASCGDMWRTPLAFDGFSLCGRHTIQLNKFIFFPWTTSGQLTLCSRMHLLNMFGECFWCNGPAIYKKATESHSLSIRVGVAWYNRTL